MDNFYKEILKNIYNVNQGTDLVTYEHDSDNTAEQQKYISAFNYLEEEGYLRINFAGNIFSLELTSKGIDYIKPKLQ